MAIKLPHAYLQENVDNRGNLAVKARFCNNVISAVFVTRNENLLKTVLGLS